MVSEERRVPDFPSTLKSLGNGCQKLKYLFMEDQIGLDNSGVISLVQNCHDLEHLVLISKNISSGQQHYSYLNLNMSNPLDSSTTW
jgi:hypothetical protein